MGILGNDCDESEAMENAKGVYVCVDEASNRVVLVEDQNSSSVLLAIVDNNAFSEPATSSCSRQQ